MTKEREKVVHMKTPQGYTKTNAKLPEDVYENFKKIASDLELRNAYIKELRAASWSLQSIADAAGISSRERVRQIVEGRYKHLSSSKVSTDFSVPALPLKEVKQPRVLTEPSEQTLSKLLELKPSAQKVRSHSPNFRKEAEQYTELINHAITVEGVSVRHLGKRLGVSPSALRFRMARYGYITTHNGNSVCYQPILDKNRYVLQS
jgi:lambda repressor-like predicted transcriptional regulator